MTSTVDSTITAFVRGLKLPRGRRNEVTELPPEAVIADHLEVLRRLGAGANGVVYLARDTRLQRVVACKLVAAASEAAAARAEREAHAMARLAHPNVLSVYEVGRWAEFVYITMEYVDGSTLRKWQLQPGRQWREIVAAYVQAARGLHAAHLAGLVHRDFKPDNVLIGRELADGGMIGRVRVGDFGLARSEADGDASIAGTPAYMAPEQVLARVDGPRADQFSYGVSLFEALCDRRPYAVPEAWSASPSDLRLPLRTLPQWLRTVLVRVVALDPAARFEDLGSVADELERGLALAARRRNLGILIAAVAVTGALGSAIGGRVRSSDSAPSCTDDAALAVWSPQRSATLGDAFARTGSPLAREAHTELDTRVGGWVAAWSEQRRDACEAAAAGVESQQLFDRRNACLDRALAEVDAMLAGLASTDREGVARARASSAELPALAGCADAVRLLSAVALPQTPELAEAVERGRVQLDRARAATTLGRVRDATIRARAVHDGDTAADYPPLRAEAALTLGMALAEGQEFREAQSALEAAFNGALAAGYDEIVAKAAEQLVCNAANFDRDDERARQWVDIAESAASRIGSDVAELVTLRSCRAHRHIEAWEYREAETLLHETLAARDETRPDATYEAGVLHDLLGMTMGGSDAARAEHELASNLLTAARGATHPRTLEARTHLGTRLRQLNRPGEALAVHLSSLETIVAVHGPESAVALVAYDDLGQALAALGARKLAAAYLERGLEIARNYPEQGRIATSLAMTLSSNVEWGENGERTIALAREAVALATSSWGPSHEHTAWAEQTLGGVLVESGQPEEGLVHYQAALASLDENLGPASKESGGVHLNMVSGGGLDHLVDVEAHLRLAEQAAIANNNNKTLLAGVSSVRAERLRASGDLAGARVQQRRAVELMPTRHAIELRGALMILGEDEINLGDPTAGMIAVERARAMAVAEPDEMAVTHCDLMIAVASWSLGEHARARKLARQAIAEYDRLEEPDFERAARKWLAHPRPSVPEPE